MSNLKQVALASSLYASDHEERFPWTVEPSETNEFAGTVIDCCEPLRPHVAGNTKVFVCPTDTKRTPATNSLQSANLGYFINLSSRTGGTNQILAGDRHLATNDVAAGPGRILLRPGLPLDWTRELHPASGKRRQGVVGFMDGHVEVLGGGSKTRAAFDRAGLTQQTLLIP